MLTRQSPYEELAVIAIADHVLAGGRPSLEGFLEMMPLKYNALMHEAWSPYPAGRPSFRECCRVLQRLIADAAAATAAGTRAAFSGEPDRSQSRGSRSKR